MSLVYRIEPESELLIVRVIDDFGMDEFYATMEQVLNDADFKPGMNSVWDVRAGTLNSLTGTDMYMISEYISSNQEKRGEGYKLALVVSSNLDYGLSRMYEIISNRLPNLCREFTDYEEAIAWLSE